MKKIQINPQKKLKNYNYQITFRATLMSTQP